LPGYDPFESTHVRPGKPRTIDGERVAQLLPGRGHSAEPLP
jgi:hypothetical protein